MHTLLPLCSAAAENTPLPVAEDLGFLTGYRHVRILNGSALVCRLCFLFVLFLCCDLYAAFPLLSLSLFSSSLCVLPLFIFSSSVSRSLPPSPTLSLSSLSPLSLCLQSIQVGGRASHVRSSETRLPGGNHKTRYSTRTPAPLYLYLFLFARETAALCFTFFDSLSLFSLSFPVFTSGDIAGHSRTGALNESDFVMMLLRGFAHLQRSPLLPASVSGLRVSGSLLSSSTGSLPSSSSSAPLDEIASRSFDMSPVDYVSAGVAVLAREVCMKVAQGAPNKQVSARLVCVCVCVHVRACMCA